jgi:Fe2+ transport system protein FeoA
MQEGESRLFSMGIIKDCDFPLLSSKALNIVPDALTTIITGSVSSLAKYLLNLTIFALYLPAI